MIRDHVAWHPLLSQSRGWLAIAGLFSMYGRIDHFRRNHRIVFFWHVPSRQKRKQYFAPFAAFIPCEWNVSECTQRLLSRNRTRFSRNLREQLLRGAGVLYAAQATCGHAKLRIVR